MASFKEMDPNDVWKLLEGHQDVVSPEVEKERIFLKASSCPRCGSQSHDELLNELRPFSQGQVLPNKILRCLECRTEFDPYTRLITKALAPSEVDSLTRR